MSRSRAGSLGPVVRTIVVEPFTSDGDTDATEEE